MQSIETSFTTTTEVNRSKFITHLVPIADYEGLQDKLKAEHPKANHVVYALRYLNEFDQIVENSSDDGEPKGCAGVPALNVLRGENLVNCAILIVRYFGGIKLGTGGMARAYALASKDVVHEATLMIFEKKINLQFSTSYSDIDRVLYILKKLNIEQYEHQFETQKVNWSIYGSKQNIELFKNKNYLSFTFTG